MNFLSFLGEISFGFTSQKYLYIFLGIILYYSINEAEEPNVMYNFLMRFRLIFLAVIMIVAAFVLKHFLFDKGKIEIELIPEHPGFTNMRISDKKAWDELFERTNFSDLKTIPQGKTTLKLEKPIKKVVLIITDKKQEGGYVFKNAEMVGSSSKVYTENDKLIVKMYIEENLVDAKLINDFISDTFWLIAQDNFAKDTDIYLLSLDYKKNIYKHQFQLIRLK